MADPIDPALVPLLTGEHRDPFSVLGAHTTGRGTVVIRAMRPDASRIDVRFPTAGAGRPMKKVSDRGLFQIEVPGDEVPDYRLAITFWSGHTLEIDDPYRYGRVLTDFDLHLLGEGTHYRAFEKLGAHRVTVGSTTGVHFAVWAPNASRVSVVGDFNGWDGRIHPMRLFTLSGIWEIFLPDLPDGERYKFEIRTSAGQLLKKCDPYAVAFEHPPQTASVVRDISGYTWQDESWMTHRHEHGGWMDKPMSIYEVHLGSWARVPEDGDRVLTYVELAERLVPYVVEMGFTHIELLPVMEHPFTPSWGYQVIGFYAPTSRYGSPEDFKFFVDACHRAGIGVILDWVPGHFPKDAHGLAHFDGTALYEHADPRQGEQRDWGTLVFNYGRHEVRNFLLSNALFWLEEYHLDGLRVDAVASMLYLDFSRSEGEWIPNKYGGRENLDAIDFLQRLNALTHGEHPGTITAAEESTSFPGVSRPVHLGGLGFTYKWNMGWMHDLIEYAHLDPVFRRWSHNLLTFPMLYNYSENFILPFSHDEVVHGKGPMLDKMSGDRWQQFAMLRALYGFMLGHPGKKLLFMGDEFAQPREWSFDRSLDWHLLDDPSHGGMKRYVQQMNRLLHDEKSLHETDFEGHGFRWIDCADNENSVVAFMRQARDPHDFVVLVFNFTPVPRFDYRVGVPEAGYYAERLNSDAAVYGGGDVGNSGGVYSDPIGIHGFAHSIRLTLPPLGCLLLKRR